MRLPSHLSMLGVIPVLSLVLAVADEPVGPVTLSLKTFDEVWTTVNQSYHDPEFGGLDWEAVRDKYRPLAEKAEDAASLRLILNRMLAELGESHFGVIPGSQDLEEAALIEASETEVKTETDGAETGSEEQGGIEEPEASAERQETAAEGCGEGVERGGSYSGIHLRLLADRVIVSRVDEGSPGARAGVTAGQTVKRIGTLEVAVFLEAVEETASKSFSREFFVLQFLGGLAGEPEVGERQTITVINPKGQQEEVTLEFRPTRYPGMMSVAMGNMESVPIHYEERRLPLPEGDVLCLRFNIFLPQVMTKLRESIKNSGDDVVGLIIDVRGNPGGLAAMAGGLAGLLTDEQFALGKMKMRAGEINFVAFPQRGAFLGPVVVLIDRMTGSTAEIFAAGLQEAGRARVIGRRSMGAALPSFIRDLPNGDRLQHAIADLKTAMGRRVEGRGVIPNDAVPLRPKKLFRGKDPDLDQAMKWFKRQLAQQ